MSLYGALFSGVSGLAAQTQSMAMISDNISNVNTVGYKETQVHFSTLVTDSATQTFYTPGGVRSRPFALVDQQGLIQASSSPTDLAISGGGFFVVNENPSATGEYLYTRAGSFVPDSQGNMLNSAGFYLQGWRLDANGNIPAVNSTLQSTETINVSVISGTALPTATIDFAANLISSETVSAQVAGLPYAGGTSGQNMASGTAVPDFSRSIRIYDSLGTAHDLTISYIKTAPNTWGVELYSATGVGGVDAATHTDGLLGFGTVTFNGNGTLAGVAGSISAAMTIDWDNSGSASNSTVTLNLGTVNGSDGLTQFDSPYNVAAVIQNGGAFGNLNGISVDEQGFVVASFNNGTTRRIYKLPIATFAAPHNLANRNGNVYQQTNTSGDFNLREASVGGAGRIVSAALEAANVDLAEQFTKMIITQRAFAASSKVISTSDEMLDELIRLIR